MSRKFIRCSACGSRIYLGDECWTFNGLCGKYCSAQCFAECIGELIEIDEQEAENCHLEIYDEFARKTQIKAEMVELHNKLEKLNKELEELKNETTK